VAVFEAGQLLCLLVEVVDRGEGLCLLDQPVDQLLAGAAGHGRDVEDRLFRVELGALATDLVEIVDQVAFKAQEPSLEYGEKPDRTSADDHHVRLDDAMVGRGRDDGSFGHCCPPDGLWACGSLAMPVSASTAPVSRQVCWPQEGAGRRAAASAEAAEEGPGRAAQPSWSSAGKQVFRRCRAVGVAGEGHPPVVAVQAATVSCIAVTPTVVSRTIAFGSFVRVPVPVWATGLASELQQPDPGIGRQRGAGKGRGAA
jgi:hypothetical protein